MSFNLAKENIVYPSWAHFSYRWENLPELFAEPLETKYLRQYTYEWSELGYSSVTDNFELIPGPFGNGIIRRDNARMTDVKNEHAWLPGVILRQEAKPTLPPGISIIDDRKYQVCYLSPKPTDDEKLGFKKQKDDPLPYFSIEPIVGMENIALVCIATTRLKNMPPDFQQFPSCLKSFGFESKFSGNDLSANHELVEIFLRKWNLTGFWFFVDLKGLDCGMLLAALVYLGGHFKQNNPRLKSIHIVTSLAADYKPMCSKWTMQKLR